ncbi:carboxynorspermidine/carboxyspermidine decarboxylase [Novosphingobium sediminis]|uniref:Carboxynorspermidine/carboxyspermidine decarboxylase n=1 Tax=Novosphingobium sediminis TaxID=707214 RepID=A0A512AF16_9SPHN|nr:carboxynorspermidine decarboxylase [Novosphingobium sediminis]GEN98290.1 carboxynorspermidine/carboxyspermidine decarboxylase [Novosphingobium sediminis]
METRAGDPGAFAHFDLSRVDSPAFVVDAARLRQNLSILADVRDRAGIKVLAALKAFSMWRVAPLIGEYLDGVCTSGLWEARLAADHYAGEIATYCAAYKAEDLAEILQHSDHVIFNSPGQHARFAEQIAAARAAGEPFDIGLRINPLHAEGEVPRYDPCAPHSRLGFPVDQLETKHLEGVSGLHFHTLCEQDFEPLLRTWEALKPRIAPFFGQLKWLNFGGGHHITRADYQREDLIAFLKSVREETGCEIYLEPGEAVALDAGILVGTVLDTHWNGMQLGITDISATCHMPDVIEAPYRPAMLGELPLDEYEDGGQESGEGDAPVRLGGPSCLAGDVIGDYRKPGLSEPGTRFAFLDQAHYSMVKTTTFNGVPLPSIWLWDSETDSLECVKRFSWEAFRDRVS